MEDAKLKVVAVLSSTVCNRTGTYLVACEGEYTLADFGLEGTPSYVGHPDTAALLAGLGVSPQGKGALFGGLAVGESFLAVPLQNPDRSGGWVVDQALADLGGVRVTLVTRLS